MPTLLSWQMHVMVHTQANMAGFYLVSMILYNYKCKQKIIYNYNYSYFSLDGICVLNVPLSSVIPL